VVLGALVAFALLPGAASGIEVFDFSGTATDIGIQRGPGQVGGVELRFEGSFVYDGQIDLSNATVTFYELLAEMGPGGAGELIKTGDEANFLPITLDADNSSEEDEGKYLTPSRFRPQLRFEVENQDGIFEFRLKLDRGLARRQPRLCKLDPKDRRLRTQMTHSFTIDDGVNPAIEISTVKAWECALGGFQMRAR
jgi:hypothetical protein